MSSINICKSIAETVGALFECSAVGEYTRIRTPWVYPDGDVIDIFCREVRGALLLTDLGETNRWLHSQTWVTRLSPRSLGLMSDACSLSGVTFERGMLTAYCSEVNAIADVLFRLSEAAVRVSDISYTFRTRVESDTYGEVEAFLKHEGFHFERGPTVVGYAKTWTPDLVVGANGTESFVHVVAASNKGSSRRVLEHTVTMWHDCRLGVKRPGLIARHQRLISLLDDKSSVWQPGDVDLLHSVSDKVCFWTKQDEFAKTLRAA